MTIIMMRVTLDEWIVLDKKRRVKMTISDEGNNDGCFDEAVL